MPVRTTQSTISVLADSTADNVRSTNLTATILADHAPADNVHTTNAVAMTLADATADNVRTTNVIAQALVDKIYAARATQIVVQVLADSVTIIPPETEPVPDPGDGYVGWQGPLNANDNYEADAKSLVKDQYKGSLNYNRIVDVMTSVMKDYETIIVSAAEEMLFGNAIGEQLDEIGRQLGVPRTVVEDDEYRAVIALTALKRANTGTRDDLYDILSRYASDDMEFVLGADSQVDVNVVSSCISDIYSVAIITELLPINTYYRITDISTNPFGFNPAKRRGFGSTANANAGGPIGSRLSAVE